MSRIPVRIIEILLSDDADTVERIMDHFMDGDFPCCDGKEGTECALLTISPTRVYMSEETGAFYDLPEGGVPIHTRDLASYIEDSDPDDWSPLDVCGEVLTINQDDDHWVISCARDAGHDGPHAGDIPWPND